METAALPPESRPMESRQLQEVARPSRNGTNIIKVSSTSRTTAVAGAIAGVIREQRVALVQAIGASAVNQAIKAVAIARTYLEQDGLDLWCQPSFVDVEINGQERTALRLHVVAVPRGQSVAPAPPTNNA